MTHSSISNQRPAKSATRVPRFLSLGELASRLDLSAKTLRRAISAGDLRGHRLGNQIRISEDDALTFISARRR